MKILLTRLDHLGDLVLMTPLIRALAKAGHTVDIVTLRWLTAIFEGNPHVGETFAMEDIAEGFPKNWRRFRNWIKARKYDVLLLPNPRPKQLLWASLASGTRQRLAMQAGVWGRLTFHHCIRVGDSFMKGRHFSDIQLDFARALGVPSDGLRPEYFCSEDELTRAREKMREVFPDFNGEPIFGIHPGSLGNTCNLPSSTYGELVAVLLARTNGKIVITGSTKELPLLDSWPKEVIVSPRVYNSMGVFDLRSLAATLAIMDRFIVGSTGPLHIATAVGTRTTSPFCSIPPIFWSVWGNATGRGTCVSPNAERCAKWTATAPPHHHCDFRGEVTAEDLWTSLSEVKSIQH